MDRRILTTYLDEYLGDFLFDAFQPFHFFTGKDGSTIDVPQLGPRDTYLAAIEALPLVQSPEVGSMPRAAFDMSACAQLHASCLMND